MRYFLSIQYLRGVAAAMVVIYHVGLFLPVWSFEKGNAGVDIFFVISGFVMYLSGRELSARAFLAHRIVRIVPLYWLATGVTLLVLGWSETNLADLFRSLLFIAYDNPGNQPPVSPILSVGWTLNLEMMFYVVFAAVLWVARGALLPLVVGIMVVMAGLGSALPDLGPVLNFYTTGIIVEFALGLILAHGVVNGWFRVPPGPGLVLVAAGVLLLIWQLPIGMRLARYGLPALLIVSGALAMEPRLKQVPFRPGLVAGDISYALYLSHILTIHLIHDLVYAHDIPVGVGFGIAIVAGAHLPAYLLHRGFEKPVTRALRKRI